MRFRNPIKRMGASGRLGSGKGSPEYWAARVKPGRIIFEIDGVADEVAREALRLGAAKLPISCKIISRADFGLA